MLSLGVGTWMLVVYSCQLISVFEIFIVKLKNRTQASKQGSILQNIILALLFIVPVMLESGGCLQL